MMPRLNRRTFMQCSALTVASSMLSRLSIANQAFAQSCNPSMLVSKTVPANLAAQPQLMALRAETLLQQIQRNCGYFGQPRNWTSLWSYSQLSGKTQDVLTNSVQTYNALGAMQAVTAADLQQDAAYDNAIQTISTFIQQLRDDIDANQAKLQPLLDQIAVLGDQADAQKLVVDATQAAFNAAVLAAAGNGCSFLEIIKIVAAVVAVVAAVFTAGSSLVAAYAAMSDLAVSGLTAVTALEGGVDLFNKLKDDYTKLSTLVKQTETAISTAIHNTDELTIKYKALQTTLAGNANTGRVIVEETKFDGLTQDRFNSLSAAVNGTADVSADVKNAFLNAVRKYFDLVSLRNRKIYEYDSSVMAIQNDARQYYEVSMERATVQTAKANLQNNTLDLSRFQEAIQRVQTAQLQVMRLAVWEEKRAYAFSRRDPSLISDTAMADIQLQGCGPVWLLNTHSSIASSLVGTTLTGGTLNITTSQRNVKRTLTDEDRADLQNGKPLNFRVLLADWDPDSRYGAMVIGFKVTFTPDAPDYHGSLWHMGHHQFVRKNPQNGNDTNAYFSSLPNKFDLPTGGMGGFSDIRNLGSDSELAGVSAFGDWQLVSTSNTPNAVLSSLQSFTVTFEFNSLNNG